MHRALPALIAVALTGCGTDVTGPSSSLLSCVFGETVHLAGGAALQVQGSGNQAVCLDGNEGAEFVYIPFHGAADSTDPLSLELTGAGVTGPGTAVGDRVALTPGAPLLGSVESPRYARDHAFHDRLRRREVEELEPRIRAGTAPALELMAQQVPAMGDLRDFNTAISCEQVVNRTGRVVHVSNHAIVYADTTNPADLAPSDYAFFGATFDTLVYPVETTHFGEPADIDGNGRAILFFTRAVNELNPQGSQTVTIGFFWSGDLFPETETDRLQACPASNHGEMFYLIAPDPDGNAGAAFTLDQVRDLAIPLIGHEFQHLINASRRLFVNDANAFEVGWLNEGLSHAAEELLFLDVAGLGTDANLDIDDLRASQERVDAFNQYMGNNFNNFALYLSRPDTASLLGPPNDLTTRGAAWAFLRYAADRSGRDDPEFYFDVVNGSDAGLANLDRVIGSPTSLDWIRDWTVSLYADDAVEGVDPRFTVSTWNYRSLFGGSRLGAYPLRLETLQSGQPVHADLDRGAAVFNRFAITAGGRAVILVDAGDGAPPDALRGTFLRIR